MNEQFLRMIKLNNENTVFKALDISIEKLDSDETIVSLEVDKRHLQHMGIVHGGIYVLLAESAASLAGAYSLDDPNMTVVGLEINANHIKSISSGVIRAHSRNIHNGRRTMVYEIRIVDNDKNLISLSRCTLMKTPLAKPK
jgi:1,4-dihydroxy-2-naphthoyl-CoA hydrolase